MNGPTPRIQRLREHVLALTDDELRAPPEPELLPARAWMATASEPWTVIRDRDGDRRP